MKKLFSILLVALLLAPFTMMADNSKALRKARDKERKEVLKRFKKEGWSLFGSAHSLEVALLTHYDKLDKLGDDGREFVGVASNIKSKNVGRQMAMNSATISYAQEAGSSLRGRILTDISADGTGGDAEFEHFYGAFEREVTKEIKGEVAESFSVIRDNGNGTYEIQSFYIVSESAASKARIRALDNALKESEAAQRHAEKISAFVRGE